MLKYFKFDNEPISGMNYLLRLLLGTVLVFLVIGLWFVAATAYKRAGAIGWSKGLRIIAAVTMPVLATLNLFSRVPGFPDIVYQSLIGIVLVLLLLAIHLVLLFVDGNENIHSQES